MEFTLEAPDEVLLEDASLDEPKLQEYMDDGSLVEVDDPSLADALVLLEVVDAPLIIVAPVPEFVLLELAFCKD